MRWLTTMTLALALLAGCSSTPLGGSAPAAGGSGPGAAPNAWLGDLPLPPGSVVRADQSLIIGAGENWVGRAVLDVGRDADGAYRFFLDKLAAQGWSVVAAVRGRQSLLVLTRQERTLTVEMTEPMLGAPTVVLTMAPRNASVIAPRKP